MISFVAMGGCATDAACKCLADADKVAAAQSNTVGLARWSSGLLHGRKIVIPAEPVVQAKPDHVHLLAVIGLEIK